MKNCFIRHELPGGNLWSLHDAYRRDMLLGKKKMRKSPRRRTRSPAQTTKSPKRRRIPLGSPVVKTVKSQLNSLDRAAKKKPQNHHSNPAAGNGCYSWAASLEAVLPAALEQQGKQCQYGQQEQAGLPGLPRLPEQPALPGQPGPYCDDGQLPGLIVRPVLNIDNGGCEFFQDNLLSLPYPSLTPRQAAGMQWAATSHLLLPPQRAPDLQAIMGLPTYNLDAGLLAYTITHPTEPAANEAWLENAMQELADTNLAF